MTATIPAVDNNKQNEGKRWKIVAVITSVVAVCGIGFGVYGIVQSSQKDIQISSMSSEIAELKKTVEKLENDISEVDNTTTETIVTTETDDASIVINDWTLKIKIPESISNISYVLESDHLLSLTGTLSDGGKKSATVDLIREEKTAVESGGTQWVSLDEAVFVDENYAYYLMLTSTMPERDLTTDKAIMEALSDSALYSKI